MFNKKKKGDDFDFDKDLGPPLDSKDPFADDDFSENKSSDFSNFNSSSINSMPNSFDELHNKGSSSPVEQSSNTPFDLNNSSTNKDIQLINYKLDAIKSELDALMQHVIKLERDLDDKKKKPLW
jgi:hypothetical protein